LLLEDPSSSDAAFRVNVLVSFMIVLGTLISTIETMPYVRSSGNRLWFDIETSIVVIYTIESILRLLAHSDSWSQLFRFLKYPTTIIDAIAIIPYYVELILARDTTYEFRFTILRLLRLIRVFRAFKYSSLVQLSIEVMIVALQKSADALGAFFFFVFIAVMLFSSLIYITERGVWDVDQKQFLTTKGEVSKFDSIPSAFWFVMVTMTTTGFGDMVPTTFVGRLIAIPAMMCGILLIALPSIIVGRHFTTVWEVMRRRQRLAPHEDGPLTDAGMPAIAEAHTLHLEEDHRLEEDAASDNPDGYQELAPETQVVRPHLLDDVQELRYLARTNQKRLAVLMKHFGLEEPDEQE